MPVLRVERSFKPDLNDQSSLLEPQRRAPEAFDQAVLRAGGSGGEEAAGAGAAGGVLGVAGEVAADRGGSGVGLVNQRRAGGHRRAEQVGDDLVVGAAED